MSWSKKERTPNFEITWSLRREEQTAVLDYAIEAFEEVFVSDRLWDYDAAARRVPDPFGVYRFVHDGSLRLVFSQAPKPPNVRPRNIYKPLYSRIVAGETHRRTVRIALPVDEYSALARDVSSPAVLEEVSLVYLVIGYATRASLDEDPAPPINETAEAGYMTHHTEHFISSMPVDRLPVKRRKGYIARFPLPGEPPPGPFVRPAP